MTSPGNKIVLRLLLLLTIMLLEFHASESLRTNCTPVAHIDVHLFVEFVQINCHEMVWDYGRAKNIHHH